MLRVFLSTLWVVWTLVVSPVHRFQARLAWEMLCMEAAARYSVPRIGSTRANLLVCVCAAVCDGATNGEPPVTTASIPP